MTFEAKTPDVEEKELAVKNCFGDKFHRLLVVRHTLDKGKEIPGACSNKNYGLHAAYNYQRARKERYSQYSITLTSCDTDSKVKHHLMYENTNKQKKKHKKQKATNIFSVNFYIFVLLVSFTRITSKYCKTCIMRRILLCLLRRKWWCGRVPYFITGVRHLILVR